MRPKWASTDRNIGTIPGHEITNEMVRFLCNRVENLRPVYAQGKTQGDTRDQLGSKHQLSPKEILARYTNRETAEEVNDPFALRSFLHDRILSAFEGGTIEYILEKLKICTRNTQARILPPTSTSDYLNLLQLKDDPSSQSVSDVFKFLWHSSIFMDDVMVNDGPDSRFLHCYIPRIHITLFIAKHTNHCIIFSGHIPPNNFPLVETHAPYTIINLEKSSWKNELHSCIFPGISSTISSLSPQIQLRLGEKVDVESFRAIQDYIQEKHTPETWMNLSTAEKTLFYTPNGFDLMKIGRSILGLRQSAKWRRKMTAFDPIKHPEDMAEIGRKIFGDHPIFLQCIKNAQIHYTIPFSFPSSPNHTHSFWCELI